MRLNGTNTIPLIFKKQTQDPLLSTSKDDATSLGYMKTPHLVKNQLVFCSQGNVFLTTIQASGPMPAIKLTTAVGNVIDRLLHGYVVDFLQVHWAFLAPLFHGGYFPAFNVADAAITGGAIGLIIDELRRVRRAR